MAENGDRIQVRVREVRLLAEGIRSYTLSDLKGALLPSFAPGAHIDLFLRSGLVRQYSLVNEPLDLSSYVIAVLRDDRGRGGSKELHDTIKTGDLLHISSPRDQFSLATGARRHVFVAGGIGITPIISMIGSLVRQRQEWQLHYCVADRTKAAFLDVLSEKNFAPQTLLHVDGGYPVRGLNVEQVAAQEKRQGTHLYCCGPTGLMERVRNACCDWPANTLHFESFGQGGRGKPNESFEIEIASTGQLILVEAGDTIIDALRRQGIYIPFHCRQGVCGTCIVDVLEGTPDHRDSILFEHERKTKITTCCSRSFSSRLKLNL